MVVMCHFVPPMKNKDATCYQDDVHIKTANALQYFTENQKEKQAMMITSSFFVDLVLVVTMFLWVFQQKSWRFPLALVLTAVIKLICNLYRMRVPEGSIWEYPGWISISV